MDYGVLYGADCRIGLVGYTDSDWAGSVTNRKSTSRCYFSLRTAVIAWCSRKQTRMVFITTQGEHVCDRIEMGAVGVSVQVADVLTKPLPRMKFG
jgi:hypothetical protein